MGHAPRSTASKTDVALIGTRLDCDTLDKQPIMRHRRNWTGQMRRTNECGGFYTVSLRIASVQPRRCEAHNNTDYTLCDGIVVPACSDGRCRPLDVHSDPGQVPFETWATRPEAHFEDFICWRRCRFVIVVSRIRSGPHARSQTQSNMEIVHLHDILFVKLHVDRYAPQCAEHDIRVEGMRPDKNACRAF